MILVRSGIGTTDRCKEELRRVNGMGRGKGGGGRWTYRFTPVFLGFLIESIQSGNPYFTHRSQGLVVSSISDEKATEMDNELDKFKAVPRYIGKVIGGEPEPDESGKKEGEGDGNGEGEDLPGITTFLTSLLTMRTIDSDLSSFLPRWRHLISSILRISLRIFLVVFIIFIFKGFIWG
jgi:hypothetical protein